MDQKLRKRMTMNKVLHLRDDVDKLYVSRREEERGLTIIEDNVDASIQQPEDYMGQRRGRLITPTKNKTEAQISTKQTKP